MTFKKVIHQIKLVILQSTIISFYLYCTIPYKVCTLHVCTFLYDQQDTCKYQPVVRVIVSHNVPMLFNITNASVASSFFLLVLHVKQVTRVGTSLTKAENLATCTVFV